MKQETLAETLWDAVDGVVSCYFLVTPLFQDNTHAHLKPFTTFQNNGSILSLRMSELASETTPLKAAEQKQPTLKEMFEARRGRFKRRYCLDCKCLSYGFRCRKCYGIKRKKSK